MDYQTAFNVAFGIACGAIGWLVRVVWEAQRRVQDDLSELERRLPETYARRDDLARMLDSISDRFDRLERLIQARD